MLMLWAVVKKYGSITKNLPLLPPSPSTALNWAKKNRLSFPRVLLNSFLSFYNLCSFYEIHVNLQTHPACLAAASKDKGEIRKMEP